MARDDQSAGETPDAAEAARIAELQEKLRTETKERERLRTKRVRPFAGRTT